MLPPLGPSDKLPPPCTTPQVITAALWQIDAVLVPNASPAPAANDFSSLAAALGNTRNISTFVVALQASGLQSALLRLRGTVFVPTDKVRSGTSTCITSF